MGPIDFIVMAVIAVIVGGAVAYIIKAKKSGKKCIGCPDSGSCGSQKNCSDGGCGSCCHCHDEKTK
ncbi:MAG: FeoB-associated Cys-rich membrane protein [Clostridia bacterium]|nr:FeoB-associated Cys-rich membrane protein [Clostridia bacterium]